VGAGAARIFFLCTVCLGFGVLLGALGTRMIYGDPAALTPAAKLEDRECPACPAPTPCPGVDMVEGLPEDGPSWEGSRSEPGLPLMTLEQVEARMIETSSACRIEGPATVLMELTITASAGLATVQDAIAVENSARAPELSRCLVEQARLIEVPCETQGAGVLTVPLRLESALPSRPELR